jgi:hypothetical protein
MVKRIFVISQPQVIDTVGGAITVFTDFCNILADNGYDVTGMCFTDKKGQPKKLQENVKFVNLRYYNNSKTFSEGLNAYGKKYHPDLFIFFFPSYYREACLLPEFDSVPRILMFHSRPDAYILYGENYEKLKPFYKNTIAQILFPSYFDILPDFIRKSKVVCIPNWLRLPKKSINNEIEHKKSYIYLVWTSIKGLNF